MKEMKLDYESLRCEVIEVMPEGVLCASGSGDKGIGVKLSSYGDGSAI